MLVSKKWEINKKDDIKVSIDDEVSYTLYVYKDEDNIKAYTIRKYDTGLNIKILGSKVGDDILFTALLDLS